MLERWLYHRDRLPTPYQRYLRVRFFLRVGGALPAGLLLGQGRADAWLPANRRILRPAMGDPSHQLALQ